MLCVRKECRATWRELHDVCPVAVCAAAGHFLPCVSSWKDPRTKGHPGQFHWRSAMAMVLPSLCVDAGSQGTCTHTTVILRVRYSLAVSLVYKRPSLVLLFSLHAGIGSARRPRHGSRINYSVLAEQKKYNIVVSNVMCLVTQTLLCIILF